jgi:DNA-binding response OmpR family regulator
MSELQNLRDRVEELEALIGMRLAFEDHRPLGFSKRRAQILGILLNREIATRDFIFTAVWGGESNVCDKIIDVHVSKIRKRLKMFGANIENIHNVGYRIPEADRKRLKAMLENAA